MTTSIWPWPDFIPREFACKCPCRSVEMDVGFMSKLQLIRTQLMVPMVITSGFRCPEHNVNPKVSTTGRHGPHTTGHAADVRLYGHDVARLIEIALRVGITGIGVRQKGAYNGRFIHLDDLPNKHGQPRPWIWSY